jgi:hypothetical protein
MAPWISNIKRTRYHNILIRTAATYVTVIWGDTGRAINFKAILKIVFIKSSMNNGTFHINAIFGGFGMGWTGFFLK